MRFRQVRRAFPWRTATLLALLFGVPVLAFAAWFVWEIEPLQSYYLPAYRQCSKTVEQTGAATEIRWLMKTAPGRASLPAIPSDVTTGKAGNLSIHLSLTARNSGWIGLEKSASEQIRSAELEDLLRRYIYGGFSYSNLIAFPLLEGCVAAVMIAGFIGFTVRAELWREWNRLWQEVIAADSSRDDWWDAPPLRYGISERILLRKWMGKVRSKLADWTTRRPDNRTTNKAAIKVPSPNEWKPGSVGVQPANARIELAQEAPTQAILKNPVQGQSIFPGARRVNGAQQEPVAWNESQWID